MVQVEFYTELDERMLQYVVIAACFQGRWLFCKHKSRTAYELPGGHIKEGESARQAAERELWEETGAIAYNMIPSGFYSVSDPEKHAQKGYGALYYAEITRLGPLPPYEIEAVALFQELPECWTYPEIQPKLLHKIAEQQRRR